MARKSYNRHDRFFSSIIGLLVCVAVVLLAAIVIQTGFNSVRRESVPTMTNAVSGTNAPMTVLSADNLNTPVITPEPTVAPTPMPTEEPFDYLPVYNQADTDSKIIAITLDDCSNLEALKTAAQAAAKHSAKLTLLPIASRVMQEKNSEALRYCVFELGFQVENRTLNNSSLYGLDDFSMAKEIWTADTAVDYALMKDYSMHLLRPMGGVGLDDPRTHAYLKQLGYDGFLTWSYSATNSDMDALKQSLRPGQIYLFNCTTKDVEKLVEFLDFANNRGYRVVTVNELLGFEENACVDPVDDIIARQLPMLQNYSDPARRLAEGDRSNRVYKLQVMLLTLGCLEESNTPDGVFGPATTSALMKYQASKDILCTGVASMELQQMIYEDYVALNAQ